MKVLFIYIRRLVSNKIFSPSNKIQWEVGLAKDLSASRYVAMKKKKMQYGKWHISNTVRPQSTLLIGAEDFH
jgi:hypothetical protein